MSTVKGIPKVKSHIDRLSSHRLITLPGLVDIHCHIREPGYTHKEDYASGTAAALAGGVTLICVMPNTDPPVVDESSLRNAKQVRYETIYIKISCHFTTVSILDSVKFQLAKAGARCDYALFVGATEDNYGSVHKLANEVFTLKMYLNETFNALQMSNCTYWMKVR